MIKAPVILAQVVRELPEPFRSWAGCSLLGFNGDGRLSYCRIQALHRRTVYERTHLFYGHIVEVRQPFILRHTLFD